MDGMVTLAKSMKAIAIQVKGSTNPNPAALKTAAETLQRHAGETMLALFPEGSTQKASEARAEIWQNWDRFALLAKQLKVQAQGLAMAAENPLSGIEPVQRNNRALSDYAQMAPDEVFTLVTKTCASCHRDFRLKK
jgi:cytochrome c556